MPDTAPPTVGGTSLPSSSSTTGSTTPPSTGAASARPYWIVCSCFRSDLSRKSKLPSHSRSNRFLPPRASASAHTGGSNTPDNWREAGAAAGFAPLLKRTDAPLPPDATTPLLLATKLPRSLFVVLLDEPFAVFLPVVLVVLARVFRLRGAAAMAAGPVLAPRSTASIDMDAASPALEAVPTGTSVDMLATAVGSAVAKDVMLEPGRLAMEGRADDLAPSC